MQTLLNRIAAVEANQRQRPIRLKFTDRHGARRSESLSEMLGIIRRQGELLTNVLNGLECDPNHPDVVFDLETAYDLRHQLLDLISDNVGNHGRCYVLWAVYQELKLITTGFQISRHVCGTIHLHYLSGERVTFFPDGTMKHYYCDGTVEHVIFGAGVA